MKRRVLTQYSSKTLFNAWRRILDDLNAMKESSDNGEQLDAIASVTDRVLDRIEAYSSMASARGTP